MARVKCETKGTHIHFIILLGINKDWDLISCLFFVENHILFSVNKTHMFIDEVLKAATLNSYQTNRNAEDSDNCEGTVSLLESFKCQKKSFEPS